MEEIISPEAGMEVRLEILSKKEDLDNES